MLLWWWVSCARDPDWLRADGPLPSPEGCPAPPPAAVEGEVTLHLWLERGVPEARADDVGRVAAAWWARQGLRLVPAGVERMDAGPALGGDAVALEAQVAGLPPEQAEAVVLDAALGPLRDWMRTHAVPARHRVDVVIVGELVPPDSPMARVASDVAGLTLAPGLLADDAFGARVSAHLGLPEAFTPTVLLSDRVLARLPADQAAWVLPHELGHALGLPHEPSPGNLMAPGFYRCPPGLDPGQAAALRLP